ncbi:MAG: hypothetical protein EXR07_14810 [Acetobacteraceae bacterium]|nr:hypothetical protein [Acetobacteraceae bacterium]
MARRILWPCLASLLLYAVLFGVVLDRPLSLGMFRHQIESGLARGATADGPKLVIIAGSNGPYSHRCETMEPLLGLQCVNAGIAVGIGLDYLFARWRPLLRPGDIVYLPLEEAQYTRTRAAAASGPDAAIMFRHDRETLAKLPPDRWAGAVFAFGPRGLAMSLIETALVRAGFVDPRAAGVGSRNAWGDHVGHGAGLGRVNTAHLAIVMPRHHDAVRIPAGDGTAEVGAFVRWAARHGILAVGGLPAGFADSPVPDAARAAIRAVFIENGGRFIDPGDRARYPRSAFFDTPDHLNEPAQIAHSRLIAAELAVILAPARAASR